MEETIYTVQEDEEENEIVRVCHTYCSGPDTGIDESQTVKKQSEMLFVRGMDEGSLIVYYWYLAYYHSGDSVVLISPQAS